MRVLYNKFRQDVSGFTLKETIVTICVIVICLLLTVTLVIYNRRSLRQAAINDFQYSCNQIRISIEQRLWDHAQLLRSGKGLFATSDTVTHQEWHSFYINVKVAEYLPGIQGFGYSLIVPEDQLDEHEEHFRKVYHDYKPDYKVYPVEKREIYTSIIMLEPHNPRNQVALGYDMFSEPLRRKAMEMARDSNFAMMTGLVRLVQEIDEDVQPGVLMYAPDYRRGMPLNTVDERRAALKGWVYCPYRMNDLMQGIRTTISFFDDDLIHFKIYDDTIISDATLLYDSFSSDSLLNKKPNIQTTLHAEFNGKIWTLNFSGYKPELTLLYNRNLVIVITGLVITLLLFILSVYQIRSNLRRSQIEALNRQLEVLNKDKDKFIAILSHDLKSPFTSILGFLELLKTGLRKFSMEQIESHINTVHESAINTYKLLEDLLTWTRAHTGKIQFNPETLNLKNILDSVLTVLNPMAETKELRIETELDPSLNIYADKNMLKAVIRNLISNAVKFTSAGSVTIKAWKEKNSVTVCVIDTGRGMKPEQKNLIFDISKNHVSAGTNGERGTGLGLIICKEFIELHGGRIWFSSEWGKGSEFTFTLPDKKA